MNVNKSIFINKSKSTVLNLIKSPNNLEKFHPYCSTNFVETWGDSNSLDYIKYNNGTLYKREFIEWNEDGYLLNIYQNKKIATVKWFVKETSNLKSIINIKITPIMPFNFKLLNFLLFQFYVKHKLKSYLLSVLQGLKFYLEKKECVKRDQFGKHSWYSH